MPHIWRGFVQAQSTYHLGFTGSSRAMAYLTHGAPSATYCNEDSFSEEVIGWLRALASDVVSTSPEQIESLHGLATKFGLPESWLRDAMSYTVTEIVASMLPAIVLALNWNQSESEDFARMSGGLVIGAVVSKTPILAALTLAAFSRGYSKSRGETVRNNGLVLSRKEG